MRKYIWVAAIALFITGYIPSFSAASRWGANYFPNVPLDHPRRERASISLMT